MEGIKYKVVLIGGTGTGKTAQYVTMPEPRYADLFDPASDATLGDATEGATRWWASPNDVSLRSKDRREAKRGAADEEPKAYNDWARAFSKRVKEGFFDGVGTYMLDSLTLLGVHALSHQLWFGYGDERMAHRRAGEIITNVVWQLCQLPCHVLLTLHTRYGENREQRNEYRPTIPGGSTLTLPRFVSALWYTHLIETPQGPRWQILTRPQREYPLARTPRNLGPLSLYHDVTIEDWSRAASYGIGAIIKKGEGK